MKHLPALALITLLTTTGCWTLGGGGGDDGPVPVEEMGQEIAGVFCDLVDRCIGPGFLGTGSNCQSALTAQFEDTTVPRLEDAIGRGTVNYDPEKMRECIDAMAAAGCAAFDQQEAPAACEAAMAGTVPAEGSCFIDEECAGDAFCNDGMSCPGTCERYLAVNDDCTQGGSCGGATTCFDGVCRALARAGQPCGGGVQPYCASGLDCVGEGDGVAGTCQAEPTPTLAGVDEPCDPEARELCQSGLSCVITSLQGGEIPVWECKAGVASGAACFFGVPDQCPDTEYCAGQPSPTNLEGICTPLPGESQPCAEAMAGEGCQPGMICRDSVCFRPRRLTESCGGDGECVSDHCDPEGMVCAVPAC